MMLETWRSMLPFILDDRLAKDTIHLLELPLCRFLLMNDRRYPWLILVPRYNGLSEIHDLRDKDQSALISEITVATRAVEKLFQPEKINVAALGNMVSQLHIHVIARFKEDEAWPNPVWGIGKGESYSRGEATSLVNQLLTSLSA